MVLGVIFDLDGVLVTTDEFHYLAWKKLAEQERLPFSRELNQRLRGVGRMESLEIILEQTDRRYTDARKMEMASRKNATYRRMLAGLTAADRLPGAMDMVRSLKQLGVKVAVGSSSRNTPLILERTGLADQFEVVVDGNDISRSKPDPEVFLLAAQRLGLRPAECLVVEDAPAGVEAARRAGMPVLAIDSRNALGDEPFRAASLADLTAAQLLSCGDTDGSV